MAYGEKTETKGQTTTPYLDYLEKIFDKKFITANQSKFCTKDGKIDFKKLEQVLVKEGYSEGFVCRLVNDLKNEKIRDEDIPEYKRTAKFNLNRERLEEIYGKHGAKVARAVLDFFENNGDIKSEYIRPVKIFSALGYITPKDVIEGRKEEIIKSRKEKLRLGRQKSIEYYNKTYLTEKANLSNLR
jgi:hypothetical protein